MKNLLLIACICLLSCQKELSSTSSIGKEQKEVAILGKWELLSMTDNLHNTFTSADACIADDRLELNEYKATISQGNCIAFPGKDKDITFMWRFLSDNIVDMGGDTVRIVALNDTSLVFKRNDPQYLEYHWKKPR